MSYMSQGTLPSGHQAIYSRVVPFVGFVHPSVVLNWLLWTFRWVRLAPVWWLPALPCAKAAGCLGGKSGSWGSWLAGTLRCPGTSAGSLVGFCSGPSSVLNLQLLPFNSKASILSIYYLILGLRASEGLCESFVGVLSVSFSSLYKALQITKSDILGFVFCEVIQHGAWTLQFLGETSLHCSYLHFVVCKSEVDYIISASASLIAVLLSLFQVVTVVLLLQICVSNWFLCVVVICFIGRIFPKGTRSFYCSLTCITSVLFSSGKWFLEVLSALDSQNFLSSH